MSHVPLLEFLMLLFDYHRWFIHVLILLQLVFLYHPYFNVYYAKNISSAYRRPFTLRELLIINHIKSIDVTSLHWTLTEYANTVSNRFHKVHRPFQLIKFSLNEKLPPDTTNPHTNLLPSLNSACVLKNLYISVSIIYITPSLLRAFE